MTTNWLATYVAVALGALLYIRSRIRYAVYDNIPTAGYSNSLLSYITAAKMWVNADEVVQEGYQKYRGGIFKIPFFNSWRVVVTGHKFIEELRQARDEQLSFAEAMLDEFQLHYTTPRTVINNPYHPNLLRVELTKHINDILPRMHEEMVAAFADYIPITEDWSSVKAMETILKIVARVTGSAFVGPPVCRDPDYLDVSIAYTTDVIFAGLKLAVLPSVLRGFVAKFITHVPRYAARATKHLGPVIEGRRRNMELYGDNWLDRPNDLLQWLIEAGKDVTVEELANRILVINFASIHTTSMAFANALYRLAVGPEYVSQLREEVEPIISEEGWTKPAIQRMHKLDSFLKECMRVHSINLLNMERLAVRDFTFSDGTYIPKGTMVCVASDGTHSDNRIYDNPDTFDPWRFSRQREEVENPTHQATSVNTGWVIFGLGRHTCPGRFFAVDEIKLLVAYTLMNYDVKMEQEGVLPAPICFHHNRAPSHSAKVLFRKRQT